MSRYRYSSSGFTDSSSDISFDDDWADEDDLSDEIFDGFEETYPELQVPCTAADHRTCQIVDHLPALNNLLSSVGLRLRELSEGDGQLAVVDSRTDFTSWLKESGKENSRFLAWLLNSHRCVTSLYLHDISLLPFLKEDPDGVLDGNSSLTPLNVGSRSGITDSDDVCEIIPKLMQLEKLEVLEDFLGLDTVEALSEVQRTRNLSALKVFCYECDGDEVVNAFVSALKASSTLRELRCASALETLSRHPALVAELAEVLTVTDAEAASLVRTRLSHIQDMNEFMRLAGVVKDRVTCEPREDGCKQLCDLNEDCWRHVMRYLKLDDICYPSETAE
ncbi:hypothetical protein HPB52_019819 [Rhipicephalus sanguineus]|uniref:Uncharacterized protein n=1 Tax=Rhipicephalus sanguineus TaxID=34632 RepID=A0A9D4PLZ9_RHISA|nr:hypothetical protein HPB52_019819 [Rhipicephalus sanguineus]